MANFRLCLAGVLLTGTFALPTSPVNAAGWSTISGEISCIEGASGTTYLREAGAGFGGGDQWAWSNISGNEDNFSLTLNFTDGGAPFDTSIYYQFWLALRQTGELCSGSYFPWGFYPPLPPPARFVATSECTPELTGSGGGSAGTIEFIDLPGAGPEFQRLTLNLDPQTAAGTFTYTINFVCGAGDGGDNDGIGLDLDLSHHFTKTESSLPDTL